MRVSTNQMFYSGTSNILNGQGDLYKTQNQLSTGRRILSPRDNPVDSTVALMTTQSKEVNATFMKNQEMAGETLSAMENQLGQATDLLQNILSRSIQGGNSSYNPQQKQAIAEINEKYEAKLAQAKIMAEQEIKQAAATGNLPMMEKAQAQLYEETTRLESERENQKQKIREGKS